MSLAILFYL